MLKYIFVFCICSTFFYAQQSQGGLRSSVITQALRESLDEYGYWTKIKFSDGTEITSGNNAGTQTSQNINILPNGVLTFGANSTVSLPSLGVVLQLAELSNIADIDSKISNTNGTVAGNLSVFGTLYAERFNYGGTGTVHESAWTEVTNGAHHIEAVGGDIYLDSYVQAEDGMVNYGTLTTQNIQVGSSSVVTLGTSTEIVLPSQSNVRIQTLELAALDGVTSAIQTQLDSKISNTNGTVAGNLSVFGTLYAERLNHGGTGTVHDSDWSEVTNGAHHIEAVGGDIYLDSYVNAEAGIWTNYSLLLESVRPRPFYHQEFLASNPNQYDPFMGVAVLSGGAASVLTELVDPNHPGIQKFTGSSTANSGYYIRTGAFTFLIDTYTGPYIECIYKILSGTATHRIGFIDSTSSTPPVDGAYLEYNGTMTVVGKTASASVYSTTTTSFTGTVNTWYRSSVTFNTDGGTPTAYFTIIDSATDTILWTDELNTNIPTAAGRETGAGLISTTPGTSSPDLFCVDWMALKWWGWLTR